MKIRFASFVAALCTASFVAPLLAQTDLAKFPLSKAIPDDVFIAVSARANPERKFLDDYWAEVMKAFHDSGVLTDAWDMISDSIPDENVDEVEDTMDRFGELCRKVDWTRFFDKEFVYCGRFNPGTPGFHEGMFIGRSETEKAEQNFTGLKRLLSELEKFINTKAGESVIKLEENKIGGASVASIVFPAAPGISINIAQMEDVVFVNFGGVSLLKDSIGLLSGESDKKGLIASARFKQAFDQLPPAEDTLVFFDVENMMGTFRTMMAMFAAPSQAPDKHADADKKDSEDAAPEAPKNPMQAVSQLLHEISIVDYVATSEWTDGYRAFTDSITVLRSNAKSSPIYDIVTSGKPTSNFERYIPREAVSFDVSSGINLGKLYTYLVSFVSKEIPEGGEIIKEWDRIQQAELNLDVRKDVIDLIEGSCASFSMGNDWVVLCRVTDSKKMDAQVNRLLEFLNGMLGKDNALMMSPVKVGEKVTFKQISHPMMMMMGGFSPPVIGCAEDHLIIGSSAKAVKTCLNTAAGKHDNITKNKRWQEEALVPSGSIISISFTDQSNLAQELQAACGAVSMALGMAGMAAGEAPPPIRKLMTSIPPILAKLGPVAGRLDFFKSTAAYESFDGKKWTSHTVQNYKKASERPARSDEEEESADNGEKGSHEKPNHDADDADHDEEHHDDEP